MLKTAVLTVTALFALIGHVIAQEKPLTSEEVREPSRLKLDHNSKQILVRHSPPKITGDLMKWHRVTLTYEGPKTSEDGDPNPFLDYRLNVTFTHPDTNTSYHVPGFFAADGNAAESSAVSGRKWRVHFTPDKTGEWHYQTSFVTGENAAINDSQGKAVAFDGVTGRFEIAPSDKTGRDHRSKGRLEYVGQRYWQYAETGEWFLKGGSDSPENFLAYAEFDHNPSGIDRSELDHREGEAAPKLEPHTYAPHLKDWRPGDPTWKDGKGKSIIGALNYLASEGMNSVYFLTMNVEGDGNDVWMWTRPDERFRFDCSKLAQWEIVFTHMDRLGILLHIITQETENDQRLDGGELGPERKLYYRELIARFAHHPAVVWNLGEENTNTDAQRKAFANYITELDPYDHPIVVHTYPGDKDKVYEPLLGFPNLHGPSLQMGDMKPTHATTKKWIDKSQEARHPWVVNVDEIGPANTGVKPDADDPEHNDVRHYALWGNLMAGGGGAEWYFGYNFPHNDLNAEDWRSRDRMWDYTRYALEFFHNYLPFTEMTHADELAASDEAYCFAKKSAVYAVYLPNGGTTQLTLPGGRYRIRWYNPREGTGLFDGTVHTISGTGEHSIGLPPSDTDRDWTALIERISE